MENIFLEETVNKVVNRINKLQPSTKPQWGKMSADQMLAHCNVTYAFTYEPGQFKKPGTLKRFLLKTFVKNIVVSEKPYPKNSRTSPEFIMVGQYDFEKEKARLIDNILKTQKLGFEYFDGKDNFSFGKMTGKEWNALFYKHLDHHLTQFGV